MRTDDLWALALRIWCEGPDDIDPLTLTLDEFVAAMRRHERSQRWWTGRFHALEMDVGAYELDEDWGRAESRVLAFLDASPPPHFRLRASKYLERIRQRQPVDHSPFTAYEFFADHKPPSDYTEEELAVDLLDIALWRRYAWSAEQLAADDDATRGEYFAHLKRRYTVDLGDAYVPAFLRAQYLRKECLRDLGAIVQTTSNLERAGDLDGVTAIWQRFAQACPCTEFLEDPQRELARLDRKRRRLGLAS